MPINKITIENFKGIGKRVEIPLRPITLLFGANSAGKSTILQALLYLRDLLDRENADADRLMASGAAIDLGGFRQFVHQHDTSRVIRVGITATVDQDGLPVYLNSLLPMPESEAQEALQESGLSGVKEVGVEVGVQWNESTQTARISFYEVSLNGEMFGMIEADSKQLAFLTDCSANHSLVRSQFEEEVSDEEPNPGTEAIAAVLEAWDIEKAKEQLRVPVTSQSPVPVWGEPLLSESRDVLTSRKSSKRLDDDARAELSTFGIGLFLIDHIMVGAGEVVTNSLRKLRYIGPLRDIPDRTFAPQRSSADDRWATGSAAWDLLHKSAQDSDNNGLVKAVSETLGEQERLNLGYRLEAQEIAEIPTDGFLMNVLIRLAADAEGVDVEEQANLALEDFRRSPHRTRLVLVDTQRQTQVDPCDIGSGVSQIVPVIVGAIDSNASLTVMEQPELHMHPAVQCALGDVFVREVDRGQDRAFLLETHSEHLLLRLMKRIRQSTQGEAPDGHQLDANFLSVIFVETYEDRSVFRPMPINEKGDLVKAWPGGFFEEDLNEMM